MEAKCGRCGSPMIATGEIGDWDGDWQCPKCDLPEDRSYSKEQIAEAEEHF